MKTKIRLSAILLALAVLAPSVLFAGCDINLNVKNTGNYKLDVSSYFSKAKIKGGSYRRLKNGLWFSSGKTVKAGATEGDVYKATFGCSKKRRYKIYYYCRDGSQNGNAFTEYYPSTTGWTTSQTLTVSLPRCN